jgi:endoglucanase
MRSNLSKFAFVAGTLLALAFTSAIFAAEVPKIDDFDINSGYWYNFTVADGNATASISNQDAAVNAGGYAELAGVSLYINSWSDWAQASLGVSAENNGVSYDLAQCREGFSYKYKGNAHRFSLLSKKNNLQVIHYEDIASAASNWTPVTVNSFVRDEYDAANCYGNLPCSTKETIPLNLSNVEDIQWSVRPVNEKVTTTGYLQIKDFECETAPPTTAAGIASYHGRLHACGSQICGEKSGKPVQVKGPSFFMSNSNWAGHEFLKTETLNALVDGWNATLVRAPLSLEPGRNETGTANGYGYEDKPDENWSLVKEVADAAIAKDIYVIVDWHSHFAHEKTDLAKEFFTNPKLAGQYGNNPNVIFEIYNEPTGNSWAPVKTYANAVIKAIRDAGFKNLILIGTPYYSAQVNAGISDLPTDPENNYAFVFHFYANSHKIDEKPYFATSGTYRSLLQSVLNVNRPIFVSEYGIYDADGLGTINAAESDKWHAFLNEKKISSAAWHVGVGEVSGLWLNSPLLLDKIFGANISHWTDPKNMTRNGRYLYRLLTGKDTTTNGQEYVIQWPKFTGTSSSIPTSSYYGWTDEANGATYTIQDIANGGKFEVRLGGNISYAGFGTWIASQSIGQGKCQYGIAYSYLGAAHQFSITPDDNELSSGRSLKKTTAWTQVTHQWNYFDEFSNTIKSLSWAISVSDANKTKDSLLVKDVLCLDQSSLPSNGINLPQNSNQQTFRIQSMSNAIVLENLPKNTKVEVYNLQGKQIYSAYPENPKILRIGVQTKGIYIVKVKFGNQGSSSILRVPVL